MNKNTLRIALSLTVGAVVGLLLGILAIYLYMAHVQPTSCGLSNCSVLRDNQWINTPTTQTITPSSGLSWTN